MSTKSWELHFVGGEFERVGNEGFRRLIEYPGGANRIRAGISMTAPVFQESASEEIAMTPPVVEEEVGDRYRTTLLVPSQYTPETLQQPTDPTIRSRAEPARSVASPFMPRFHRRNEVPIEERELGSGTPRREPGERTLWRSDRDVATTLEQEPFGVATQRANPGARR